MVDSRLRIELQQRGGGRGKSERSRNRRAARAREAVDVELRALGFCPQPPQGSGGSVGGQPKPAALWVRVIDDSGTANATGVDASTVLIDVWTAAAVRARLGATVGIA